MREEVMIQKFENLSTEIAEMKSIQKNTYTEVMRLRDWKDNISTNFDKQENTLAAHIEDHKETKATSLFIIGPVIGFVSALATMLIQYVFFKK